MFKDYFADADYWDLKHITADVSLRDFIAGMLGFEPWWIAMLYRIRELLVIGLGLVRHEKPEDLESLTPDRIPFTSGEKASFFIVHRAEEDRFWVAETPPDNHLSAYFGIVHILWETGAINFPCSPPCATATGPVRSTST
ncbi:DUF2867 domain-containing protein [Desulfosarcina cetonica]|uniref:DUF2867 domain-containing protein n=1 Tax=Desulfosarcina cetonica TaxID=90730 RepID=UPI0006D1D542|nr:DUF2867 domain-containing protein [Desulfosarcina cetonica]